MEIKELTEQVKKAVAEELEPLRKENAELKVKVEALEKQPATNHMKGLLATGVSPRQAMQNARRKQVEERLGKLAKALPFMRVLRAVALSRLDGPLKGKSVPDILRATGYEDHASDMEIHAKAMTEGSLTAGGALVPEVYSADFIEVLRPYAVVRSMSPIILTMDKGNISLPKGTAATSANYVGEAVAAVPSDMAFGNVKLNAKKLAAIAAMSNDLIRRSDPDAEEIVLRDLLISMALGEDIAFIRGTGSAEAPRGIKSQMNAANSFASTQTGPTATLSEVTGDLMKLQGKLEDNNVRIIPERCFYIMHPRAKRYLETLRDGVGNYVFKDEIAAGKLLGFGLKTSTQIPTNLGDGTQSEVYFTSADELLIGDTLVMETVVDPNGTYTLANGTVVSGLSNDLTPVRVISEHDFMLRHDVGAAMLTGVKWAA